MARFVHIEYPAQHGGVTRITRGLQAVRDLNTTHAVLGVLAFIGSPVTRATAGVRRGLASWVAARKQRREDEKLWNMALTDARIMADLSRAMSQEAVRQGRYY